MFRNFTANNTYKYIDVLDDFVDKYHNTRHTSIKMTNWERILFLKYNNGKTWKIQKMNN